MNTLKLSDKLGAPSLSPLPRPEGSEKVISRGILLAITLAMTGCGGIEEKGEIARTNVVDKTQPAKPLSSAPVIFDDVPTDQWNSNYIPVIPADLADGGIDDGNDIYRPDAD